MTPERIARLRAVLDRRQPDLAVVTDFVNKQRSLSAIVRNCDAAGVMRLHAVIGNEVGLDLRSVVHAYYSQILR